MKFQKRQYQSRAISALRRLFKKHRRVLAVAPTGSGKTVIAARFLHKYPNDRVLWVAHRVELLRQARSELIEAGVSSKDVGILTSVEQDNPKARILVTSVGMWRVRALPKGIKWVVFDEAHRSAANSYRSILERAPKARLLGLTATPVRTDGSPLGHLFDHLLVMATPTELVADGFVPRPRCFGVDRGKAREIVKGMAGSDIEYTAKAAAFGMRTMYGNIVDEIRRLAGDLQTIVFTATREYGQNLLRRLKLAEFSVEYLDGTTPAPLREAIIGRLGTSETQVVVNVDVLSEGFDCPPVKCIVLARPTRSLTRLLQQCGRASRAYKGQRPIIIDSAGNFTRFPLPTFDHEWALTKDAIAAATLGECPNKICPFCEELIPVGCRECPECGAEQPTECEWMEQEAILAELRETEAEKTRREMVIRELAKRHKKGNRWLAGALAEGA